MSWDRHQQGRTVTQRGYGHDWRKKRAQVKARAKGLCEQHLKRGFYVLGTECDHITPKAKGGTDDLGNLQWLCTDCHRAKTIRDEGGAPQLGCDANGSPRDPLHHWSAR